MSWNSNNNNSSNSNNNRRFSNISHSFHCSLTIKSMTQQMRPQQLTFPRKQLLQHSLQQELFHRISLWTAVRQSLLCFSLFKLNKGTKSARTTKDKDSNNNNSSLLISIRIIENLKILIKRHVSFWTDSFGCLFVCWTKAVKNFILFFSFEILEGKKPINYFRYFFIFSTKSLVLAWKLTKGPYFNNI